MLSGWRNISSIAPATSRSTAQGDLRFQAMDNANRSTSQPIIASYELTPDLGGSLK